MSYGPDWEEHRKDFEFTVPANYYVTIRVHFNSSWENNLVLYDDKGPTAIAQWNNYYDNNGHRVPNPKRYIDWGPWPTPPEKSNRLVKMFFTQSYNQWGPPGNVDEQARWLNSVGHTVQNTAPGQAVITWGDKSPSSDAVKVELYVLPPSRQSLKQRSNKKV